MMQNDRFLFGIVLGSILLAAVSLIMVLRLPEPVYGEDSTPDAVVHNYLLALQRNDYERAYEYLDKRLPGYPASALKFQQDIASAKWSFSAAFENKVSLEIVSTDLRGSTANVKVQENAFHDRGIFSSSQSTSTFMVNLARSDSTWKITYADSYWVRCWHNPSNYCP